MGVAFASRVGILLQVASIRIGFMIVHMQIDVTVWASLRYDDTPSRTHPHSLPSLDTSYTHTYRDLCTTLQGIEDQNRRHEQQLRDKLTSARVPPLPSNQAMVLLLLGWYTIRLVEPSTAESQRAPNVEHSFPSSKHRLSHSSDGWIRDEMRCCPIVHESHRDEVSISVMSLFIEERMER